MAENKKKIDNIRFDFNKAVQETLRDYPQLREKTAFYDVKTDNLQTSDSYKEQGGIPLWHDKEKDTVCRALRKGDQKLMIFAPFTNSPINTKDGAFAFDHELGHLLAPNKYWEPESRLKNENIADAFATIRHFQRYGLDTPDIQKIILHRSLAMIEDKKIKYFTSPVISQILADRGHVDFLSLSPEETLSLAEKYVEKYTPTKEQSLKILDAFSKHKKDEPIYDRINKLIETCFSTLNKNVFIAAAQIIFHYTTDPKTLHEYADDPETLSTIKSIHYDLNQCMEEANVSHFIKPFQKKYINTKTSVPKFKP